MSREEHDLSLKILLIGDSGAGKTSLLLRYSNNKFESSMIATIGIDFKIKTIVIKGKRIKLQVWDTAGAERFRTMTQSYYRGSNGIMLVFDIMSEKSFENISYWLESIQTHAPEDITAALVGAKCDCKERRAVSQLRAQRFADQNRIKYFETSAQEGINVENTFLELAEDIMNKESNQLEESNGENVVLDLKYPVVAPRTKRCC